MVSRVNSFTGKADEAIRLYRNALQVIKDSNYMAVDDSTMEKIRIDLAELLHVVGRYVNLKIRFRRILLSLFLS